LQDPDFNALRQDIYDFIDRNIPDGIFNGIFVKPTLKGVVAVLPNSIVKKTWGLIGAKFPSTGIESVLQDSFGQTLYVPTHLPELLRSG
jgi:hypothetical protein